MFKSYAMAFVVLWVGLLGLGCAKGQQSVADTMRSGCGFVASVCEMIPNAIEPEKPEEPEANSTPAPEPAPEDAKPAP